MIKRVLSHCLLLLICSVSLVYGDCTVGGVTLKLNKYSYNEKTFFTQGDRYLVAPDQHGYEYNMVIGPVGMDKVEGISLETDMPSKKQVFETMKGREEFIYPLTDLYDPANNTTNYGETKNEYTLRYKLNGAELMVFKGTITVGQKGEPVSPYRGTFNTACGENWSLRVKDSHWNNVVVDQLSLESKALDDKNASSARKVGKTKTEEEAKKLTAFRKKAKVGSRVRVFTGNFQAKGLVTEVKKDLVKVQFTEQVIQFQWTSIKPIEQWVQRSNLLPSEGGASLY